MAMANGRDGTARLTPNCGPRSYRIVCHLYAAVTGHARIKDRGIIGRDYAKRESPGVVHISNTRHNACTLRKKSANKRETCF